MNPLAKGYSKLYDSQRRSEALQESKKEEFFGLRDFYRWGCTKCSTMFQLIYLNLFLQSAQGSFEKSRMSEMAYFIHEVVMCWNLNLFQLDNFQTCWTFYPGSSL